MKKLSMIAVLIGMMGCGESEEAKQKRLSDELMKNVGALQTKLTADTNQINRDIKLAK